MLKLKIKRINSIEIMHFKQYFDTLVVIKYKLELNYVLI